MTQCVYLRFFYARKLLRSGVPKLVACFKQTFPEVWGIRDPSTKPRLWAFATCSFAGKIRGGNRKFPIFPALPKYAMKPAVLKRKRDKYPLENSPSLNAKTAFRRFPRTKPDVPSQDLITPITLRENLQGRQSNTSKLSINY